LVGVIIAADKSVSTIRSGLVRQMLGSCAIR